MRQALEDGKLKPNESLPAKMHLVVEKLGLDIKFDGELRLD